MAFTPSVAQRTLLSRAICIIIPIISFAMLAGRAGLGHLYTGESSYEFTLLAFMAPSYTIIWSTIVFTLICKSVSYNPAIDLTFELFAWAMSWVWAGFILGTIGGYESLGECLRSDPMYDYCTRDGNKGFSAAALLAATSAFLLLDGLIHFVYFVTACRRTHRVREETFAMKKLSA